MQAYTECRADILRFLISRTGDPSEAEDIVQDLWFRLANAEPVAVENPRAYLYRAAQNLVLDRLRARRRALERDTLWSNQAHMGLSGGEPIDQSADAEGVLIEREEAAALASAIAHLPPRAYEAFQLHKIEGLSQAEVAARLGISVSGVEKHMVVAMTFIRRSLRN